jgi:hypothetical protein
VAWQRYLTIELTLGVVVAFLLLPCKFFLDDKYFFYGIIDFLPAYWSGKMLLREESEFVDVGRVGAGNNIKLARFLPSSSFLPLSLSIEVIQHISNSKDGMHAKQCHCVVVGNGDGGEEEGLQFFMTWWLGMRTPWPSMSMAIQLLMHGSDK